MYARIENDEIVEYPLSEIDIRKRFPQTSFTKNFSACLPDGYVKILGGSKPAPTEMQIVVEVDPKFVDGLWVQEFNLEDKYTDEQLQEMQEKEIEDKWTQMREDRDSRIDESTWILERHSEEKTLNKTTSITDNEYQAWLEYRQALRDLPENTLDINNVNWPTPPGILGVVGI